MKLLDRYIIWNFSCSLLLWCGFFIGIYTIFDLLNNFDSFIGRVSLFKTISIIANYYFFHSFSFLDVLSPFLFLISAITLLKRMDQFNEIIALMASGVSRIRILMPLLVIALFFSLLFFVIREVVIPAHLVNVIKTPDDYFNEGEGIAVKQIRDMETRIRISGDKVFAAEHRLHKPMFTLPPGFSAIETKITAEDAVYFEKDKLRKGVPSGWLLMKVDAGDLLRSASVKEPNSNKELILTPKDHSDFLAPDQCFLVSRVPLELLEIGDLWPWYTSAIKLAGAAKNPSLDFKKKDLQTRVHLRLLRPIVDLLPFFICLPLIFFRNTRNITKEIFFCVFITLVYIGLQYVCTYFGPQFDPALAAWLPVLIFFPIAVVVFMEIILTPKMSNNQNPDMDGYNVKTIEKK